MTVGEIQDFVQSEHLTIQELDKIQQTVESAQFRAQREYAKTFEIGDRVEVLGENGDTFYTNVTRRNKATVSVEDPDTGENVVLEPGRVLRIVTPAGL